MEEQREEEILDKELEEVTDQNVESQANTDSNNQTKDSLENMSSIGEIVARNAISNSIFKGNVYFNDKEEIDPTIPIASSTLSNTLQFSLGTEVNSLIENLKTKHFLAIQSASEEINYELMIQLCQSSFFSGIKEIQFRQYLIEDLIKRDTTITLQTLISLIRKSKVADGKKSLIFIYESVESISNTDHYPVFFNSLMGIRSKIESYQDILKSKGVFLVYFYYSKKASKHLKANFHSWHWPEIFQLKALNILLKEHFSNEQRSKIVAEIIEQRKVGLWPSSEYFFLKELSNDIRNNRLLDKLNNRQEILKDEDKFTEWKSRDKDRFELLNKSYLNRVVLFIASYFDGIGLNEFRNLANSLIRSSSTENSSLRSKRKLDSILLEWQNESDMIMGICGLQINYEDDKATIQFIDQKEREIYRNILKHRFPQFLQKQGEALIVKSTFFWEEASDILISGMNQLFRQLTMADPQYLFKKQLSVLVKQLDELSKPFLESFGEQEEKLVEVERLDQNCLYLENLKRKHEAAFLVVIEKLLNNEIEVIDSNKLEEFIDAIEKSEITKEIKKKEELLSRWRIEKDKTKQESRRAQHTYLRKRNEWGKLMHRFARLLYDLYTDSSFKHDTARFIENWSESGQHNITLMYVLAHLREDYGYPSLPQLKSMLNSPEREFQFRAFRQIIYSLVRNPFGLFELKEERKKWIDDSDNEPESLICQYAHAIPIVYFMHFQKEMKEFGIQYSVIDNKYVSENNFGKWPSLYPVFSFHQELTEIEINQFWSEFVQEVLGEDFESAWIALQHRINPGNMANDLEVIDDYMKLLADFMENWHWILTGEKDNIPDANANAFWLSLLRLIVKHSTRRQQSKLLYVWKIRSKEYALGLSFINKVKDNRNKRKEDSCRIRKRRENLLQLHQIFKNLLKEDRI